MCVEIIHHKDDRLGIRVHDVHQIPDFLCPVNGRTVFPYTDMMCPSRRFHESKYADLVSKQEQLVEERQKLQETSDNEKDIKKRLKEFKKTLEQNEILDKFDRYVFESIVEKVIVGGLDENGNVDPAQLTFVYKTGLKNSVDGAKFKPQRKNARGRHRTDELCSHDSNEVDKMCSDSSNDTC